MRELVIGGFLAVIVLAFQDERDEPIYTAADLFNKCASGSPGEQALCFAYLRGFSDGNRWLLRDEPVEFTGGAPQAVCIPNAEPIKAAAELLVVRFRGREAELEKLSPFRAASVALAGRYPCKP